MSEGPEVKFFGHSLPAQTEHKWLLGMAVGGFILTLYLVWKGKQSGAAANASPALSTTGGILSGGGASGTNSGTGSTSSAPPQSPLSSIEYKFSIDTSNQAEFQDQSNVSQGGGGSISILGLFGASGGGGGTNVKDKHIKTGVTNQINFDTTVTGNDAQQSAIQNWIASIVGTPGQRAQIDLAELLAGSQYVGGTGVSPYVPPGSSNGINNGIGNLIGGGSGAGTLNNNRMAA